MIYEFALEPALVVDWAIADFGRYVGDFGLEQRRLVSDFPVNWPGCVYAELYKRFGYDVSSIGLQNAQVPLELFVQLLTERQVKRKTSFSDDSDWLQEAVKEHKRCPFSGGIISRTRPANAPAECLEPADLDKHNHPVWRVPALDTTDRTAEAIANTLRELLRQSTQIVLIDPFFNAYEPRFQNTLRAILKVALEQPRPCPAPTEIQLFTSIERRFKQHEERTEKNERNVAADILDKCKRFLPSLVPRRTTLKIIVLKRKPDSSRLHNRLVLTDVGGASIPHGTDEEIDLENPGGDDILPLHGPMLRTRWREYVTQCQFDIVATEVVSGTTA